MSAEYTLRLGRKLDVGDMLRGGFIIADFEPYASPWGPARIAYDRAGTGITVFDDYCVWVA